MRKKTNLLFIVFIAVFQSVHLFSQDIQSAEWICTTDNAPWVKNNISEKRVQTSTLIQIDPAKTLQTIEGFGGCFNELGWDALNSISYTEKQAVLNSLFNPASGCKFTICRMPLGANDYSVNWYSHNETPGDYEMEHFSIARDRLRLIPYIKAAKEIRPDLKIWASPWCPPSWMKKNNHYACRTDANSNDLSADKQGTEMEDLFVLDDRTLSAYALYFSKFIQEYKREGINIYAVHVQNEPNSCQNFPSCIWTPEGLSLLIKQVGAQFKEDGLETEVWLGTIERPQPERVDPILSDPEARKYITGVGFQWAGKGVIGHVNKTYPELKLMQTETECGRGTNDRAAMEHTFSLMKHYFKNGISTYEYWNMVLNHTGKSQWGWKQNSMITITKDLKVRYNPEFYLMKHFSYFIKPSARFLDVSSDENCLAFLNPGNEIIIIYYNENDEPVNRGFEIGTDTIQVELQGKSLNTFVVKI